MNRDELKQTILEFIKSHSGTSYVELESLLDRLQYEYRGRHEARAAANPNVVFWAGWNKDSLELIAEMITAGTIERTPCSPVLYAIDGAMLHYPILAGDPFKASFTQWLPVVFNAC